jgi:hypothetical protein
VADEYRELEEDLILVLNRSSGRGKTSGLELGQIQAEGASVFHIREGKVTRLVLYGDRERALADVGLVSETDSAPAWLFAQLSPSATCDRHQPNS